MWKGIKCVTNYSKKNAKCPTDPALPDALNHFYARFEASNNSPTTKLTSSPGDYTLSVSEREFALLLQNINPRKAAGPDGVPGRVLKDCARQLSGVMCDIFNTSLAQATVPTCLKTSTIIPVPKVQTVTCLNDCIPVALTPIIKTFERVVMSHIKNSINITSDCHQYAYRQNRSTADAVSAVIHQAFTHLETSNSYVRLLFLDFSSAFNTIIPQTLVNKLSALGLSSSLCNWILDFLTHRPQSVRINNLTSSPTILNTGSPQGFVLSPLLYTLLTHDCRAHYDSNVIVKFADDTAVMGLISNEDETAYRQEVSGLELWCRENNLILNAKKTKELIVDFHRKGPPPPPLYIANAAVEGVHTFKYLGMHLTNTLT